MMINVTDKPLIMLSGQALDQRIRQSLAFVEAYLIKRFGPTKAKMSRGQEPLAFYYCLGQHKLADGIIAESFISAAFEFAQTESRHAGAHNALAILLGYTKEIFQPPAYVYADIKRGLKLFLIHLWTQRGILLPLTFTPNSMLGPYRDFLDLVETPVVAFFRSYSLGVSHRPITADALSDANIFVLAHHAPRIIWATDWHCFEDFSITELGNLHQAYNLAKAARHTCVLPTTPFPFLLMLSEALLCHPEVPFDRNDVLNYGQWLLAKSDLSYTEYLANRDRILAERLEHRREAERQRQRTTVRAGYEDEGEDDLFKAVGRILSETVTGAADHEAIINCFTKLSGVRRGGISWLEQQAPYPGREHIELPKRSQLWRKAAQSWFEARKRKGYDDTRNQVSALNILFDYLFLYLPWWKELHPQAKLAFPVSPKTFTRYLFIDRTVMEDDATTQPEFDLPKTLLEMIALRQPSAKSQYATIVQLDQFFRHIQKRFSKDDEMAGPEFENPIDREWDLPRQSRPGKTNKIPFSKKTFPHLLFYAYAAEAFGLYLQRLAIEKDFFSTKKSRQVAIFDTAKLGYIPVIFYRNRCYPIFELTNVFGISLRTVDRAAPALVDMLGLQHKEATQTVWLPNLAVLRMFIGALEMGLRMQSLQWLDRRTWDSLNHGVPPDMTFAMEDPLSGDYVYDLLVPTDKTKDHAWVT